MREEYEQMEFDTRSNLERALSIVAQDAVTTAAEMLQRHYEEAVHSGQATPGFVRNRHEAYGIAAEQMDKISKAVKAIKDDTGTLLGTLADPNLPALEATSSICNSTLEAAAIMINAAARMRRTLTDLYAAERTAPEHTPMDDLASGEFQEAEPAEAGEAGEDDLAEE